MNYCSHCGESVDHTIPQGDNRLRYVCSSCEMIHYQNPRIIAGCIAEYENKILLCTRAIEPRKGLWTLPAGFMENHETTQEAAIRETFEEATAKLSNINLFCTYSIPHISQVYIMYHGLLIDGYSKAGEESLDTALFSEDEIPWDRLAFSVITATLKLYFSDRKNGKLKSHNGEMIRDEEQRLMTINY